MEGRGGGWVRGKHGYLIMAGAQIWLLNHDKCSKWLPNHASQYGAIKAVE